MRLSLLLVLFFAWPTSNATAAPAPDNEAQLIFDQLFAKRVAAAKATRDSEDDVAVAGDLLSAADTSADSPALVILLCDQAYDLSNRHEEGHETAVKAMTVLLVAVPAKEAYCQQRLLDIHERRYRAANAEDRPVIGDEMIEAAVAAGTALMEQGDFKSAALIYRKVLTVARSIKSPHFDKITSSMQFATHRTSLQRKIDSLEKRLVGDGKDASAHATLFMIYVTELNDPQTATMHMAMGTEETDPARKLLPLASKSIADVDEANCMALGEWYRTLADSSKRFAKTQMLERSKAYFDRFLTLHETDDLRRTQAVLRQQQVADQLKKLAPTPKIKTATTTGSKTKVRLLTRDPRSFLFILSGKERATAVAAADRFKLRHDVTGSFDSERKDYSAYHTIMTGSNKMDYWGAAARKTPESFQWLDNFMKRGGHLVVFGAYNGRNFHQLKPYGIKTGYNHNSTFTEEPGQTEVFFKGSEKLIPANKQMRSAGNFSCSEDHTVLLRRGDKRPAVVTLKVGKGRLTVTMVEPEWIGDYWLIDVMTNWLVRGGPIGEPVEK